MVCLTEKNAFLEVLHQFGAILCQNKGNRVVIPESDFCSTNVSAVSSCALTDFLRLKLSDRASISTVTARKTNFSQTPHFFTHVRFHSSKGKPKIDKALELAIDSSTHEFILTAVMNDVASLGFAPFNPQKDTVLINYVLLNSAYKKLLLNRGNFPSTDTSRRLVSALSI